MSFDSSPNLDRSNNERRERIERLLIPDGFHNATAELLDKRGAVFTESAAEAPHVVERSTAFWHGSKRVEISQEQVASSKARHTTVSISEVIHQDGEQQMMVVETTSFSVNEAFRDMNHSVVLYRRDMEGFYQLYRPDGLDLYHKYGLTENDRSAPYNENDAQLIDEIYHNAPPSPESEHSKD